MHLRKHRTLTVGGMITVRLVFTLTDLDTVVSVLTAKTYFLRLGLIQLNYRPTVQWTDPFMVETTKCKLFLRIGSRFDLC